MAGKWVREVDVDVEVGGFEGESETLLTPLRHSEIYPPGPILFHLNAPETWEVVLNFLRTSALRLS